MTEPTDTPTPDERSRLDALARWYARGHLHYLTETPQDILKTQFQGVYNSLRHQELLARATIQTTDGYTFSFFCPLCVIEQHTDLPEAKAAYLEWRRSTGYWSRWLDVWTSSLDVLL